MDPMVGFSWKDLSFLQVVDFFNYISRNSIILKFEPQVKVI